VVVDARAEDLDLTARAGRVARRVGELGRSRDESVETELVARPADASASHEQLWAEVTVARAARSVGDQPLGPVAVLVAHDAGHGTDYVRTLAAWLDHPGEPSRAAKALHVHANTLRYRMARIADTAGLDLTDPVVRLAVRLQLEAAQVRDPKTPA
jgi:sugar diacid utilization regulator